jgi:hypothetical protein
MCDEKKSNKCNKQLKLIEHSNKNVDIYRDESDGNGINKYLVSMKNDVESILCILNFQNQPFSQGVNGISIEDLLYICVDRLNEFQKGGLACEYNKNAIKDINSAILELEKRTKDREKRKVEGTYEK